MLRTHNPLFFVIKKRLLFYSMRATLPAPLTTFALLSLLSGPCAHDGTGFLASAILGGLQRAAAAPAALATALTLAVNSSGTRPGPPTTPLALSHGAPHSHATAPAQPERGYEPAPPEITHAARAHTLPKQPSPLAGHALHTQALPGPAHAHPHVPIHVSQSSHQREKPVTSSERKKSFLTGATTVLFGANQSQPSQPVSSRHNPSQPVSTRLNPSQPVSHQSQPMI